MCQQQIPPRLVAKDPRVRSRFPPHCVCIQENVRDRLQTEQTGRFCENSICGIRYNELEQPVERDLVCRGYADDVFSGKCRRVGVPPRAPPGRSLVPTFGVTPTIYGLCDCQPIMYRGQPTLFMGSFCQTRVQGCTDPAQARAYLLAVTNGNSPEPVYPCRGTPSETRGVCELTINPRILPNVTDDAEGAYRCTCKVCERRPTGQDHHCVCRQDSGATFAKLDTPSVVLNALRAPVHVDGGRRMTSPSSSCRIDFVIPGANACIKLSGHQQPRWAEQQAIVVHPTIWKLLV